MGCHRLLRETDATLITSVDDIVEMLGQSQTPELALPDGASWPGERGSVADVSERLSSNAVRAKDALRVARPQRIDAVGSSAGLTTAETAAGLAELEMHQLARETPAGWVKEPNTR